MLQYNLSSHLSIIIKDETVSLGPSTSQLKSQQASKVQSKKPETLSTLYSSANQTIPNQRKQFSELVNANINEGNNSNTPSTLHFVSQGDNKRQIKPLELVSTNIMQWTNYIASSNFNFVNQNNNISG